MPYYNSVLVNKSDKPWMFYEWDVRDSYDSIKNIKVVKVSEKVMIDILSYHIKINNYKDKKRWLLFISLIDTVAILFDSSGTEISRSRLLLEDEADILDKYIKVKEECLDYVLLDRIELSKEVRRWIMDKECIKKELDRIVKNNDKEEAKYLYYEWFNKEIENYDIIIKEMYNALNGEYSDKIHRICELINIFSK